MRGVCATLLLKHGNIHGTFFLRQACTATCRVLARACVCACVRMCVRVCFLAVDNNISISDSNYFAAYPL